MTAPRRPRGRPPGASDGAATRQRIVDAARRAFAANGFARTSLRSIARDAGVDVALVSRSFGSKEELFVAAHRLPGASRTLVEVVLTAPPEARGNVLVRTFLRRFSGGESPVGVSLLRSATTEPVVAELLRGVLERALLTHADTLCALPDRRLRTALVSAFLVGTVLHRSVLALEPVADADLEEIVAVVGPAVQRVLDGGS